MQGNISSSSSIINCLHRLDCLDFSCGAGDFIFSSGGGLGGHFHDVCTFSCSPSCGGARFSLSSSGGLGGLFCDACSLSSGGGLGGLFHDVCSLSSGSGLGGLFCAACTLSSSDTSENGSILNSNVSSSVTILHHLELDSLSCVLCNARLFCTHFSASCLLTPANLHETGTSPGECHMCLDFETSSILCT